MPNDFSHERSITVISTILFGISALSIVRKISRERDRRANCGRDFRPLYDDDDVDNDDENNASIVLQKTGRGVDEKKHVKDSILTGLGDNDGLGISKSSSIENNSLFNSDHVAHLETNLDDISGEHLAFAIELLLQHGAIDAWVTPIVMKKGRPGHTLHCLCKDNESDDDDDVNDDYNTIDSLLKLIFIHTSTLGVRIYRKVERAKLDRSISSVVTSFTNTSRKGQVDVKVSKFKNGQIVRKKAEFDHCREISIEAGVGIQIVADQAVKGYEKNRNNNT